MKVIRGDYKIEWDWIGEGMNGEYDPHNKEDVALMRFYCFHKVKGKWEEIDDSSYCTLVRYGTSTKRLIELAQPILDALESQDGVRRKLRVLSWMAVDGNDAAQLAPKARGPIDTLRSAVVDFLGSVRRQ